MLALLTLACGDGGKGTTALRGPDQPDDAQRIRAFDFEQTDAARELLAQLGTGVVEAVAIIFADLTGDQREEAIVPLDSQGTLGNLAYLVFTLESGKPKAILTRTVDRTSASGLQMSVENGTLVETRGEFGPSDPLCCPSQLRETTFRWDGSLMQVDNEVLVQQDPGPKR